MAVLLNELAGQLDADNGKQDSADYDKVHSLLQSPDAAVIINSRVRKNWDIGEWVVSNDENDEPLFKKAVTTGNVKIVQAFLAVPGLNINEADVTSPLYEAVMANNTAMVKVLLAAPGVDVNSGFMGNRKTPLTLAKEKGFSDIQGMLQGAGAS